MTAKLESVKVGCDGKRCAHPEAWTEATIEKGRIHVHPPKNWRQQDDQLFCPYCSEERVLEKVLQAEPPDPEEDPPAVRERAEHIKEQMRQVLREELGEEAHVERELPETEDPDFAGQMSGSMLDLTEVRVRGKYVEISWPYRKGMSLTLQHDNLTLLDPPPFLDQKLVGWIQSCLLTMRQRTSEELREKYTKGSDAETDSESDKVVN